ncbi:MULTISPECIES: hypothetical protein [Aliagarivorans]|uniref:hypothetical protein n=1 Tax=Aliagarivorans TaxID=882379 RepID=UPI0003FB6676|nr:MULTISPECIES: hypothetical protein [Aliagarivorans]
MRKLASILAGLWLCCSSSMAAPVTPLVDPVLPSAQQWLQHIEQDIARFYLQPGPLGDPVGSFPTYLCNDSQTADLSDLCPELQASWLQDSLGRQYTRMLSRQIYTYGVIFHMTGNPKALAAAKAGVDYLRDNMLSEEGGAYSYLDSDGQPGLSLAQGTTQDLSYAQLGLAFYYYLTRDDAVLADILKLKDYIFSHYRSEQHNQLLWVLEDSADNTTGQLELVAQLDQINAYMLLMLPLLPEPYAAQWREDLAWLSEVLLSQYHNEQELRFYGYLHHPSGKTTTGRHGDWGHTIKAYWMLYLAAAELGLDDQRDIAEQGMYAVLERAYAQFKLMDILPDDHGMDPNTEVGFWNATEHSEGASWWQYAELDQAAQTLAFSDPSMNDYLRYTYGTWLSAMVDHEHGGILPYPYGTQAAKLHHWKNGYHGAEHALIAYLGASQHQQQPATLYFAIQPQALSDELTKLLRPYYFKAERVELDKQQGRQRVRFSGISG